VTAGPDSPLLDAERATLGAMLLGLAGIDEVKDMGLDASWWRDPKHEYVCAAIYHLHGRGEPVTVTTVGIELERRGQLGSVGDLYLKQLPGCAETSRHAGHYAALIAAERHRRKLREIGDRTDKGAVVTDPDELRDFARQRIDELAALVGEMDEDPRRVRRIVLTPAAQIKIRPVRWLWDTTPEGASPTSHGRIPLDSLCIAAGGPGLGKSQFAAWLAARITTGTLPGELFERPRTVIYAASEDSWEYTIAPRMLAAGADLSMVFRVDVADDGDAHARLTLPADIALLGESATAYSAGLVVADPLLSVIDQKIDDYRQAQLRTALEPLAAAAAEHRFTVLGLAHFTKCGAADPLARISGSGAFGQVIRSALAFARQEADEEGPPFVMSQTKNNLGRLDIPSFAYSIQPVTVETQEGPSYVSRFVLGAESATSVAEVMRAESGGEGAATGETVAWLRELLAESGGSMQRAEIVKLAAKDGVSMSTLHRARNKLGVKAQASGFGKEKTSYWSLPEA
jgi:hypothetical protein